MYYVDPPDYGSAIARSKQHNFWPLLVSLACAGFWLGAVAMFFGLPVASWCAVVVAASVGGVGLLSLLALTDRPDTLWIGTSEACDQHRGCLGKVPQSSLTSEVENRPNQIALKPNPLVNAASGR